MSKRIFRSIWMVSIGVLAASLLVILAAMYDYVDSTQQEQLVDETHLAAKGVTLSGMDYFKNLDTDNYRITWIDKNGKVLYDNQADASTMENHSDREEIQEAMKSGFGESSRYSNTLSVKQLYAAERLSDKSVIRVSIDQKPAWIVLLGISPSILFVGIFAVLISMWLASRLSWKIVEPINNLNLDEAIQHVNEDDFKEIAPLIRRMTQQQEQLKKDRDEIAKTAQIRQEFTANVSHELKTPLHAISGYAELMENGIVKEEDIPSFAGKIRAEALRMAKLVEDTIGLSKLDSGATDMEWENADLYEIARNAVSSLELTADEAGVSLALQGESCPIYGIPSTLYSIIYNLCENGIKYNRSGGYVNVNLENQGANIILTVADSGVGIPKEEQSRIFERFYRVDKSHSKEVGGTGLGLSIVKHALLIHHATVAIDSEPNKGSTFVVTLPRNGQAEQTEEK